MVSAGRGPSYEELAALVVRQAERIEQLEAEAVCAFSPANGIAKTSASTWSGDTPLTSTFMAARC